jgi:hypothetical protein
VKPKNGRANLLVSRIMIIAIIDRFIGVVAGDYKKRFTGRAKPKNGRANLLVSRIMMFAIIDRIIGVVA